MRPRRSAEAATSTDKVLTIGTSIARLPIPRQTCIMLAAGQYIAQGKSPTHFETGEAEHTCGIPAEGIADGPKGDGINSP
jgi:hypothetical protein